MIEQGSKIHLTFQEEGGYKPRLVYNKKFGVAYRKYSKHGPDQHECSKKIVLGEAFIKNALVDPEPAYKLAMLKRGKNSKYKYLSLSPNIRLHLHVKQYVADAYGLNFGGKINTFTWEIV
jgi:hypothetical protein